MLNEINDLWYNYLIEVILKKSDKEIGIIKDRAKKEDALRSALTSEQINLLEEYEEADDLTHNITEKESFAKGVKFTTRLFIEALCED